MSLPFERVSALLSPGLSRLQAIEGWKSIKRRAEAREARYGRRLVNAAGSPQPYLDNLSRLLCKAADDRIEAENEIIRLSEIA